MIDTDIKLQWHLDSLPAGSVDPLQGFFDRLPVDPYIQGRFRERRYYGLKKRAAAFIPRQRRLLPGTAINKFLGTCPEPMPSWIPPSSPTPPSS